MSYGGVSTTETEEAVASDPVSTEQEAPPQEDKDGPHKKVHSLRVLLDRYDAGAVIGKGGATINQFRESSGTQVDITKEVQGSKDRVATVKDTLDKAVRGLVWMAGRIKERKRTRMADSDNNESAEVEVQTALTLLIPNSIVGRVIGRGGKTIGSIRQETGAEVKISQQPLPGSSVNTIEISGTEEQFQEALTMVCRHVWEGLERMNVHYPQYETRNPAFPAYPPPYLQQYDDLTHGLGAMTLNPSMNRGVTQIQQTIVMHVPDHLVGSLIGRSGSTIQSIRMNSGSQISIEARQASSEDAPQGQRKVTITGPARSNEIAASSISQIINFASTQNRSGPVNQQGAVLPSQSLPASQNGHLAPQPAMGDFQSQYAAGVAVPLAVGGGVPGLSPISTSYRPRQNGGL